MMKKVLFILGTRPEAIKLAPLIIEMKKNKFFEVCVCNTEQQKDLSNQTLSYFGIRPDFYLDAMRPNQGLVQVQNKILEELNKLMSQSKFDAVVVQGDTMTVLCGALVAYYHKTPFFHVEAGLRSNAIYEPFPEEGIRQMVSRLATLHFAPTLRAQKNLLEENIPENKIMITGNTGIDSLFCLLSTVQADARNQLSSYGINFRKKIILVTVHRRENHGTRLQSILEAVLFLSRSYQQYQYIIPVHPNPNVQLAVNKILGNAKNIVLTPPLSYPCLVNVLQRASLVITDSGGIQEEAPTFGVPILVTRYETERVEGIEAGFAKLVGSSREKIVQEAGNILQNETYSIMNRACDANPYGDGRASGRIVDAIQIYFENFDE